MNKNQKKKPRGAGIYILVLMVVMGVLAILLEDTLTQPEQVILEDYSQMVALFENEQVKSFVIQDSVVTMQLQDDSIMVYDHLASLDIFYFDLGELIAQQRRSGVLQSQDYDFSQGSSIWSIMLPYLIIMGLMVVFWIFMMNRQGGGAGGAGGMNPGKARVKVASEDDTKVTFKDVAGNDEEKKDLEEVVDFLKDPKKYLTLGARIPKGVLLVGPPGTGKTLIAKAVAGEAGVPFYSIAGSDFVELYVGVGASRVRDLFNQAKKTAPSIVFIDEIDAVGRRRGTGLGGGHDEREQTLNQLLVEMDGFGNNTGVIVMAATNRADVLDPALLRPGRFDRQIYVGAPDIKGREEILHVHAKGKPFEDNVNFHAIAAKTAGFTGADLENLLNEAALLAARRGKQKIGGIEIDDAYLKVIMGNEKKNRVITDHEKKLTAFHEAGHALVTRLLPTQDPVHQVSIIPRGRAGGFTMSLPQQDKYYMSRKEMLDELVVLLGGRVAEQIVLDDISTGASNDIERATALARSMVTKYGMSDKLGPINYGGGQNEVFLGRDFATPKSVSEETQALIDGEVKRIIDEAYLRCQTMITENREILDRIAQFLLEHETMDGNQFEAVFKGETPDAEMRPMGIATAEEDAPAEEEAPVEEAPSAEDQEPTLEDPQ